MTGMIERSTGVLVFLAAIILTSTHLSAGEGEPAYPSNTAVCPDSLLRTCRDAYCSKPQPWIACGVVRSTGCFCPKPQPWIKCLPGSFAPASYCPKPLPRSCPPIFADYFRCVPGTERCTPSAEFRAE